MSIIHNMITKQYLENVRHRLLVELEDKKIVTNAITVKEMINIVDHLFEYTCAYAVKLPTSPSPVNPETDAC